MGCDLVNVRVCVRIWSTTFEQRGSEVAWWLSTDQRWQRLISFAGRTSLDSPCLHVREGQPVATDDDDFLDDDDDVEDDGQPLATYDDDSANDGEELECMCHNTFLQHALICLCPSSLSLPSPRLFSCSFPSFRLCILWKNIAEPKKLRVCRSAGVVAYYRWSCMRCTYWATKLDLAPAAGSWAM